MTVLVHDLYGPDVTYEMNRRVSLRLIRMTNLVDATQTNLMSSTK